MASAKEYAQQLAQAAGLDADATSAFLKVVENEKVAKGLEEGFMLRSDYSRAQDAVKAEKDRTSAYYQQLVTWKAEQEAALAGAGNGNGSGAVVNGEYISKAELAEMMKKNTEAMQQQERSFITIAKVMGKLASRHATEFKEELDTDALEKIAIEKQLPLQQAYEALVGPRREEAQAKSFAEKLKQAKEEGAREFASTHHVPIDSAPRESQYGRLGFDRAAAETAIPDYEKNSGRLRPEQTRTLRDKFVEEYTKAGTPQ